MKERNSAFWESGEGGEKYGRKYPSSRAYARVLEFCFAKTCIVCAFLGLSVLLSDGLRVKATLICFHTTFVYFYAKWFRLFA